MDRCIVIPYSGSYVMGVTPGLLPKVLGVGQVCVVVRVSASFLVQKLFFFSFICISITLNGTSCTK